VILTLKEGEETANSSLGIGELIVIDGAPSSAMGK
jgi:hypothetical protein